jgi:hypothetical protein
VSRGLLTALLFFLCASALRSETYEQWASGALGQPAIAFTDLFPPHVGTIDEDNNAYSVFNAPPGHLFGHLDFSSLPATAFPLKVAFLYQAIDPEAINASSNGEPRVAHWTSPLGYLAPNGRLGGLIFRQEIEIKTPADGAAVPVWSIIHSSDQVGFGPSGNSYSLLLEVTARDGTVLARKRLIEAVHGGLTSNLLLVRGDSETDPSLKSLGDFSATESLPTEAAFYAYVEMVWLDAATLADPRYDDNFWRRILVGSTRVVGHEAQVQELARRLGIRVNQRILMGGLWSVDSSPLDLAEEMKSNMPNARYVLHLKKGENPFLPPFVFAQARTDRLRAFSIWFLVLFTIVEGAIIIGSFFLLRGHRRVLRWLLIPFSAIVYTALGLVVAHLVLDFRPEVEMIQEIHSVQGWPESIVHSGLTRLAFADDLMAITAPASANFFWSGKESLSYPIENSVGGDQSHFSLRQHYGRFTNAVIRYAIPAQSPIQVTGAGQITATRKLSGAWVWDGAVWRNLGPMTPGRPVTISQGRVIVDPSKISGDMLPIRDNQNDGDDPNFLPETVQQMCTTGYMRSLKNSGVDILLAVDDQPTPEQVDDATGSEIHAQTLLVHQFTFPAAQP